MASDRTRMKGCKTSANKNDCIDIHLQESCKGKQNESEGQKMTEEVTTEAHSGRNTTKG